MNDNTISIVNPPLDYNFICHYSDGTQLLQQSGTKDEKHFGDIDLEKLEKFELVGRGKSFSVDVKSGTFNLDGRMVEFDWLPDSEYRLIYFRRVRQEVNSNKPPEIRFCLGLQTTFEKKNYKVLVFINKDDSLTIALDK